MSEYSRCYKRVYIWGTIYKFLQNRVFYFFWIKIKNFAKTLTINDDLMRDYESMIHESIIVPLKLFNPILCHSWNITTLT